MTLRTFFTFQINQRIGAFLMRSSAVLLVILFSGILVINASELFIFSQQLFNSVEAKFGAESTHRVRQWQHLMQRAQNKSETEQLHLVNAFFNQIPFVSDRRHWQQEDYWATPIEMLASAGADCEDYSLAKYFTLVHLGVDKNKLRLMYVNALELNQAHMVLTYYSTPKAVPLVLDNINGEILKANQRRDLEPVYSFNGDGLWLAKLFAMGKKVQEADNYGLWREFATRLQDKRYLQ